AYLCWRPTRHPLSPAPVMSMRCRRSRISLLIVPPVRSHWLSSRKFGFELFSADAAPGGSPEYVTGTFPRATISYIESDCTSYPVRNIGNERTGNPKSLQIVTRTICGSALVLMTVKTVFTAEEAELCVSTSKYGRRRVAAGYAPMSQPALFSVVT